MVEDVSAIPLIFFVSAILWGKFAKVVEFDALD